MHSHSQTDDEIAQLASQSANRAQRILTQAGRLQVVPLRYAFDMQGADNYFLMLEKGWVEETLIDDVGHPRVLNRVPACQGTPLRVVQWEEQSRWLHALADIATRRKGYVTDTPAGIKPVDILTARFMNNGHLVVLHRLPYKRDAHWGMIFAPPGEEGGGAHILKADWAVTYPLPQPADRALAIEIANEDAPPEVVVEIDGQRRGTPPGFYHDILKR